MCHSQAVIRRQSIAPNIERPPRRDGFLEPDGSAETLSACSAMVRLRSLRLQGIHSAAALEGPKLLFLIVMMPAVVLLTLGVDCPNGKGLFSVNQFDIIIKQVQCLFV